MTALRWIVFAACLIWAGGGLLVMLSYPTTDTAKVGVAVALNFGPLAAAAIWLARTWPGRGNPN